MHELDQEKNQFLNIVSHDIRTPLTGARAFLELALSGRGTPAETRGYLETALAELDRQTVLLDDLLDMQHLGTGMAVLDVRAVDLARAIDGVLTAQQPSITARGHAVQVDVPADLQVQADPDRLAQVLDNLVGNAVKYTPEGGTIQVQARVMDAMAHVSVRDTGVGIPADELDVIFQPFHRSSATRMDGLGTGLGLSICKQLVERHGGRIWVESTVGQESTFTFSLPVALVAPPPRSTKTAVRRILVVDADVAVQRAFRAALEPEGYAVDLAGDGPTALRMVQESPPDLVLLDLLLPGDTIPGDQVLQRLRQPPTAHIPIVALTSTMPISFLQTLSAGMQIAGFLPKPVDLDELFDTVRATLASQAPTPTDC